MWVNKPVVSLWNQTKRESATHRSLWNGWGEGKQQDRLKALSSHRVTSFTWQKHQGHPFLVFFARLALLKAFSKGTSCTNAAVLAGNLHVYLFLSLWMRHNACFPQEKDDASQAAPHTAGSHGCWELQLSSRCPFSLPHPYCKLAILNMAISCASVHWRGTNAISFFPPLVWARYK